MTKGRRPGSRQRPAARAWTPWVRLLSVWLLLAPVMSRGLAQRNKGLYSLIRDDARAHQLQRARSRLAAGNPTAAVELLLEVLQASPSAVVQRGIDSHLGLRQAARDELGRLPPDARRIYEQVIGSEGQPRLEEALASDDPRELQSVALRYPHSSLARRARLVAGERFFERGRLLRALQEFSLLPDTEQPLALATRRLICRSLLGLDLDRDALPRGASLPFGEESLSLVDWLKQVSTLRDVAQAASHWPAYGGGLDGSRAPPNPVDPRTSRWQKSIKRPDDGRRFSLNLHPVADGRRVFVNTGTRLYGIELLNQRSWESPDHIATIPDPYQREQFLESISPHFAHSAALGHGLVVAPLQVPIILDVAKENQNFNGIPIMRRLPVRRLHAFEAETGRLVWSHWNREGLQQARAEDALDVSGPPLIIDDTVYVATHKQLGTIAFYLSAFDLETGALRWRTLICSSQIEVNMFGNAQQEYAASPLAYASGTIYGATNLGVCYALRADDGSIRWLTSYRVIAIPQARMRPELRYVYWANNPPVVSGGVAVITPLDSESALALDTADGRLLWRQHYEVDDPTFPHRGYELRWVLGVRDKEVWFSGQCVAKRSLDGGRLRMVATPETLDHRHGGDSARSVPRGLLTVDRLYYLSASGGLFVLRHGGSPIPALRRPFDSTEVGNLCSSGGVLVSVRPQYVTAFFSLRELIQQARNEANRRPRDPQPALAYAERYAARRHDNLENLRTSARLYRKVLTLCESSGQGPSSPTALRAKSGLYRTLVKLGKVQRLTRPDASNACRREAIEIGRELRGRGIMLSTDLIRFYVGLLEDEYRDDDAMRRLILDRLEKDHGNESYTFGARIRTRVGAYVLMQRLAPMSADRRDAPRRLALLRRLLVEFGSDPLPVRSGARQLTRAWAMAEIREVLHRHGRKIYEPYEKEAAELLAGSSDNTAQLQVILDQYPSSRTAETALIRLGMLAAESNDLEEALSAYAMGIRRLARLPEELRVAVAKAAGAAGNHRLRDAFLRSAGREPAEPVAGLLHEPRLLRGTPRLAYPLDKRMAAGVFRTHLTPPRISGFAAGPADLPLLLVRRDELYGCKPQSRSGEPRYRPDRPDFRLPFSQPYRELESVICGQVLVLAEEAAVRGISLADGTPLWSVEAPEEKAGETLFEQGAALANGLYGACFTPADPARQTARTFLGIEPLTGAIVFRRSLRAERVLFRNGYPFRIVAGEGEPSQLLLLDPLTGDDLVGLRLDGQTGPRAQVAPRHVLVTDSELFLLVPGEAAQAQDQIGLWAFARRRGGASREEELARKWFRPEADLGQDDSFLVSGGEVLVTVRFSTATMGRMLRLDRASGRLRRRVGCGWDARLLGYASGSPAAVSAPGPVTALGQSDRGPLRLTLLNTRPDGVSWSTELSPAQFPDPQAELLPPVWSEEVVVLAIPIERRRSQYVNVLFFELRTGEIVPVPELRMKLWNSPCDLTCWNGELILRSRLNGWVFADMIAGSGR